MHWFTCSASGGSGAECSAALEEDDLDGVFPDDLRDAILFGEADAVDPDAVDDMEEEENEPEGQFICPHCRFATNDNEVSILICQIVRFNLVSYISVRKLSYFTFFSICFRLT